MKRLPLFITILFVIIVMLFFPILRSPGKGVGNFGDIYLHYYPLKHLVKEQLIAGKMPLWNPYIFAGEPLMANPQSAVAYPFSILFDIFPLATGFTLFFMIHLLLGGIGMYLLLAHTRLSATACIVGALSYACSSFLISKTAAGHPVALSGYIWLPFIVLGVLRIKTSLLSAESCLFVMSLSYQVLSGHTFPVYISLIVLAMMLVSYKRSHLKETMVLCGAVFLLCAFQLLQTFELSRLIERGNWIQLAQQYSLSIKDFITVVMPNFFGNSIDGTYIFPDHPSYYFEKNTLYFGLIAFLLSMMGLFNSLRRRAWGLPGLLLLGIILGLGFHTALYRLLYIAVPGIDFLRVPARFMAIGIFSLVILAAQGWDQWFKKSAHWFKGLLLILVIADCMCVNAKFLYPGVFDRYQKKNELLTTLDPLHRIITNSDTIAANKSMLYHHYNLNGYEAIFLEDFFRYMGLQERRIFSSTGLARTNISSALSRGFSVSTTINTEEGKLVVTSLPNALLRIFVAQKLKTSAEMSIAEQLTWLQTADKAPNQELLVSSVPKDFPLVSSPADILSYHSEPSRIEVQVHASGPFALIFSEVVYPGWKAVAGDTLMPIMRGNKIFRTILCPAGDYLNKNTIIMYFHPAIWLLGLYLSLISIIIAVVIIIKKNTAPPILLPSTTI